MKARKPTRLKVTDENGFQKLVLIDRDVLALGSATDGGLTLPVEPHEEVAPRHALIIRDGEDHILKDESGSRGTRVNGRPIRRTVLRHGDQIALGSSRLKIEFLIEGSRVSDLEQNQLRRLLAVLRDLHSELEVREIAPRAIAGVMELLGPSWAQVIMNRSGGRLETVAGGDAAGEMPTGPSVIARQVVGTSRSFFQKDHLCVAVLGREGVLGALDIGPRHGGPYGPTDLELLEAMAAHLSVALSNSSRVVREEGERLLPRTG
ncbi:MAG TPA: FHA domain-containing protein [Candidatus Polarisedimenticolia bacterium]|nr:FHA domain-containing protein [Candidatus Polarisedimenticolia bacterium]